MQSVNRNEMEGEVTHEIISKMAREEWMSVLDGGHESHHQADETDEQESYEHTLWQGVSAPYRSVSLHLLLCSFVHILHLSLSSFLHLDHTSFLSALSQPSPENPQRRATLAS